jgi:hypothetical protein
VLVIGSSGEGNSKSTANPDESNATAPAAGAVYVFGRNGDDWVQQAYLKAAYPEEDDAIGYTFSFSNGTLAEGAVGEASASSGVDGDQRSNSVPGAGAVYLFE